MSPSQRAASVLPGPPIQAALCGLLPEPVGETPVMEAVPGCHAFCLMWAALFSWSFCSASCSSRCGWCEKALGMLVFFLSVAVRTSWRAVPLEYVTSGTKVCISLLYFPQAHISTQGCDFRLSHAVLWAFISVSVKRYLPFSCVPLAGCCAP